MSSAARSIGSSVNHYSIQRTNITVETSVAVISDLPMPIFGPNNECEANSVGYDDGGEAAGDVSTVVLVSWSLFRLLLRY